VIVYGDQQSQETLGSALARLRELASAADTLTLAIECGKLAQSLTDAQFEELGRDELTPRARSCARLCLASAAGDLTALHDALDELATLPGDLPCTMREPEGYAHYALYPELYVRAARSLDWRRDVQVIGIRSIGSSLAAFVADALGSTRLPWTVRPVGHPFARELRIGEQLAAELLRDSAHTRYVVVDEGPGMSGSSFVSVARWLITHGVAQAQVALMPSHTGEPGPESAPDTREQYAALRREVVGFDQAFPPAAIEAWFADVTGALREPAKDIAGGRWRALTFPASARQPACHVRDEKRKFLLRADRPYLMKYLGLGARVRTLAARQRALSEQRFVPELLGVRRGFMLMPWLEDAVPLSCSDLPRTRLVAEVARYLSFLAQNFPRSSAEGARPSGLYQLLTHNATELLGAEQASALARYEPALQQLEEAHRPVASDNKLDLHEWLVLSDGSLRKCDAEAHHVGHDCIGAQDPAWDVAGATVELALRDDEREMLIAALRDQAAVRLDTHKLAFYELAYVAFRAGYAFYAERAVAGSEDAPRFTAELARYRARLAELITNGAP
jgi:hypothetical protein